LTPGTPVLSVCVSALQASKVARQQALLTTQLHRREERLLLARAAACAGTTPQELQEAVNRVKAQVRGCLRGGR
jgi:hypothetical protein